MNELEMDFEDVKRLVEQTTNNLRKLSAAQKDMHWQLGYMVLSLKEEMNNALHGWIASNC